MTPDSPHISSIQQRGDLPMQISVTGTLPAASHRVPPQAVATLPGTGTRSAANDSICLPSFTLREPLATQLPAKPRTRELPVPEHGVPGYPQGCCCFLDTQSAKSRISRT